MGNRSTPGQPVPNINVGTNYLAVCKTTSGMARDGAVNAHDGIRAVLDGRLPCFSMDYPCHSPEQQRWFHMNVTPMGVATRLPSLPTDRWKAVSEIPIPESGQSSPSVFYPHSTDDIFITHNGSPITKPPATKIWHRCAPWE